MARKIQGRFTNESEYLRAVARNNGLYSDEVYSNLLDSQGGDIANAFAQATIQAQEKPSETFDDSMYKLLGSDDKFGYLMTEYYMDHTSEDYSKNMTYFNEKKDAAIRQINYESLSDLEKTIHSIGGWFAQLGVSLYSGIENLLDLTSTIWEGQVRMFGLNDVGDAIRDFTNRDLTGAKAAQESINDYVSAYTVWDKSIVGNIGLGVASAIGQLAPAFIPGVGPALYWMSMAGGSINEALEFDPDLNYGALFGYTAANLAVEAATEAISGKIFGGGNVLDNIILGTGKRAGVGAIANIGINMFSEGLEEVTSELLGNITGYIIGREPDATLEDVLVAGAIGAIMGGSMGVVDIASTSNLYVLDGDVVTKQGVTEATEQAKKEGKEISATKLSKGKSYTILQAIAASDTASLEASLSAEFKRGRDAAIHGVKSVQDSLIDAEKAKEKTAKQQENNIKAAQRLAFLLKTVGVKDFTKGVDLLKRTADDVVSGVEAWKNRFNGTTAIEKKAQADLIEASGCGVAIQDRATYTPEQRALAKTIRDEYGKTVVFGKISDENGHTRLNVATHDYMFLDEADFKSKGLERSIETTVKNVLVEELMQSDLKLDNQKLRSIFQTLLGSKNINFKKDFTEEQMREVASKLLFDELSIDKVLQMNTGLFAGISRWNRKKIDDLKDKKKTPTKQYEYNTLLKIRERYLKRIAKTCGRLDDIEEAKEKCQLTDREYSYVLNSMKPNALNSSIKYFKTNISERLHAKHAVYNIINNGKLEQYKTKPGEDFIDWEHFGDVNTYDEEFVKQVFVSSNRNETQEYMLDKFGENNFTEALFSFILKQTGFVVSLENKSVYKAIDMSKAIKKSFRSALVEALNFKEFTDAADKRFDDAFYNKYIWKSIQGLSFKMRDVFSSELLRHFDQRVIDEAIIEFDSLGVGNNGYTDHINRKIVLNQNLSLDAMLDTLYHEAYHFLSRLAGGPRGTNHKSHTEAARYLYDTRRNVFDALLNWYMPVYETVIERTLGFLEGIQLTEIDKIEAVGYLLYSYNEGELLARGEIFTTAVRGDYFNYNEDGILTSHGIFKELMPDGIDPEEVATHNLRVKLNNITHDIEELMIRKKRYESYLRQPNKFSEKDMALMRLTIADIELDIENYERHSKITQIKIEMRGLEKEQADVRRRLFDLYASGFEDDIERYDKLKTDISEITEGITRLKAERKRHPGLKLFYENRLESLTASLKQKKQEYANMHNNKEFRRKYRESEILNHRHTQLTREILSKQEDIYSINSDISRYISDSKSLPIPTTSAKKTDDEGSKAKNTIKKLRAKYPTQTELKKAGFGRQTLNTLFGEKKPLFSDIWTVVLEDTENTKEAKDEIVKTLYPENKNITTLTQANQLLHSSGEAKEKGYITNPGPSTINLSLAYALIYDAVVNNDYSWVDSLLTDSPEAAKKEFKENLRQAIQDGFGNKLISAMKSSGENHKMSPKSLIITLLGSVDGSQYELNHDRYGATKTFIKYVEFLLDQQNNPDTEIIKWLISNDYDFTVTSAKKLIKRLRKGLQADLEDAESDGITEGHDDSETSVYELELTSQQEAAYMESELNNSPTSESWSVSEAVRYINSHVMSFDDIVEFVRELNFNEDDTKELAKQLKLDSEKTNVLLDLRLLSAEELSYFADEMGMTEKEAREYASNLNINSDMLNSLSENAETLGLSLKDYMTQETVKQQRRILSNIDKSKTTLTQWLFAPSGEKNGAFSSFITSLNYLKSTAKDSSETVKQAIDEKASPEYFIDILKDAVSKAATTDDLVGIYNKVKAQSKIITDFYGKEAYTKIMKYAGVRKSNVKNNTVDELKFLLGVKSAETTQSIAEKTQTIKTSRKGEAVKLSGVELYNQLTRTINDLKNRILDKKARAAYSQALYDGYVKQVEVLEQSENLSKEQIELLNNLKTKIKELSVVLEDNNAEIQEIENQIANIEIKRDEAMKSVSQETTADTTNEPAPQETPTQTEEKPVEKPKSVKKETTAKKPDLMAEIEAEVDAMLSETTEPEEPVVEHTNVTEVDETIEDTIKQIEEAVSEEEQEPLYEELNDLLDERDVLVLTEEEVIEDKINTEIKKKGKIEAVIESLNDSTYRTDPNSPFYETRLSETKGREGEEYTVASYDRFVKAKKAILKKIKTADDCVKIAQAIIDGKINPMESAFLSAWLYTRIRLFPDNKQAIDAIIKAQNATETAQTLAARQNLSKAKYRIEKTVADITKEYEAEFQPSETLIKEAVPELTMGNESEYVDKLNKKIEELEQQIENEKALSVQLEKTLEKERLEQEALLISTQDYVALLSLKIEELENAQTNVSENMEKAKELEHQIVTELTEFARENQDKKKLPDKEISSIFSPKTNEEIRRKLHLMESYRYLALLSNPATWGRNAITNTLVNLQEKLVDWFSGKLNSFFSKDSASYIKEAGYVGNYSADFAKFVKEKFRPRLMLDTEGSSYDEKANNRTKQRYMEENDALRNSKALGWLYKAEKWGLKDQKWVVERTLTNLCNMYAGSRQFLMKELIEILKPKFGITSKNISIQDMISVIKETDPALASQLDNAYNNDLSALVSLTETYNKDRYLDIYDKALFRANEILFKTDNFLTKLKEKLDKSSPAASCVLSMIIPFARTTVNTGLYVLSHSPIGIAQGVVKLLKHKASNMNDMRTEITEYYKNQYSKVVSQAKLEFEKEEKIRKEKEKDVYKEQKFKPQDFQDWAKENVPTTARDIINGSNKNIKQIFENMMNEGKISGVTIGLNDLYGKAEGIEKLSQGVVGTGALILGLIMSAILDVDIDEDDFLGPVINLPTLDVKIQLSSLAPFSTIFSMGAMFGSTDSFGEYLSAIWSIYVDQSVLGTIDSALKYSDSISDFAQNTIINYVQQYIPSAVKNITKVIDRSKKDKSGSFINKLLKTTGANLPIVSYLVSNKINPYTGETQKYYQSILGALAGSINPITIRSTKQSDFEEMAERLDAATTGLSGRFEINGKVYNITDKNKETLARYRANYIKNEYEAISSGKKLVTIENSDGKRITTSWNKLTDEQKQKVLKRLYSEATEVSRVKWWTDNGNVYKTSSATEYAKYRKLIQKNIQYAPNWSKSKFVER